MPEDEGIHNFTSFQEITGDGHEVAGLYFFQQLDCLIDFAYKVSCDFFKRPHLYINLGAVPSKPPRPLSEVLAELHGRLGYSELFPGKLQRDEIYRPIFGSGGDHSTAEEGDFPRLRDALLDAAAAFAERVFNTGADMLRERVRTTLLPFTQYLKGLQGDSIRWSRENALAGLTEDVAYSILRSAGISGIFGIETPPPVDWPFEESADGDKAVHEISKQLARRDHTNGWYVSREQISNFQRAAKRGAEALVAIIDFRLPGTNSAVDRLITKLYTWRAALLSVSVPLPMPELVAPSGTAGPSVGALAPQQTLAIGPAASSSQVAQMLAPLRPSGEIEPNSATARTDLYR